MRLFLFPTLLPTVSIASVSSFQSCLCHYPLDTFGTEWESRKTFGKLHLFTSGFRLSFVLVSYPVVLQNNAESLHPDMQTHSAQTRMCKHHSFCNIYILNKLKLATVSSNSRLTAFRADYEFRLKFRQLWQRILNFNYENDESGLRQAPSLIRLNEAFCCECDCKRRILVIATFSLCSLLPGGFKEKLYK